MPDRRSVVKGVVTPQNDRQPLVDMAKIPYFSRERDVFKKLSCLYLQNGREPLQNE